MASGNGNPSLALLASTRSPLPLAPRLTTTSSPQNATNNNAGGMADEQTRNSNDQTHSFQSLMHVVVHNPSSNSDNFFSSSSTANNVHQQSETHVPFTISRQRITSRPRTSLYGTGQPLATQALSTDSTPSTGRFAAYMRSSEAFRSNSLVSKSNSEDLFNPSITRLRSGSVNSPPFEVLPQFRKDSSLPGNVLVRCSDYNFYVHKSVLYFSSPFFRAILDGDWKETHPSLHSRSSSGSLSDENTANDEKDTENDDNSSNLSDVDVNEHLSALRLPASPRTSFHTAFLPFDALADETHLSKSIDDSASISSDTIDQFERKAEEDDGSRSIENSIQAQTSRKIEESLTAACNEVSKDVLEDFELPGRLERLATPPLPDSLEVKLSSDASNHSAAQGEISSNSHTSQKAEDKAQFHTSRSSKRALRETHDEKITAIIDLTEEDAATFQDVLCHIYPNLDLVVTWINIFPLFAFSDKFEVPYLRRACTTFLRASLAGRPIDAMALSERHGIEDVYREASRHVLDNMPSWEPEELALLSNETLLKLERKRTWFLERLLKLGLANPARDYECQSACPDPQHCAKVLHERWHAQYAATFKYGPPQPSIIWRHLRELEGNGVHSQNTTMLACQASSKAWVQSLFDRMYGLPTHGKTSQKFLAIKLTSTNLEMGNSRQRPKVMKESGT